MTASFQTRRPFLRLLLVAILVAIVSAVGAPGASAHAFLLRSTPSDGSTLDRAPTTMTLTFDENILLPAASVTLRSADGSVLQHTGPPAGETRLSSEAGPELVVGLPTLGKGTYSATWSVRSADDLHQTVGTLSFAVGQTFQPRGVDRGGPAPPVLSSSLRWLDLTGIALLLGAFLLLAVVVPRSQISPVQSAALRTSLMRVLMVTAAAELLIGIAVLIDSVGVTDVLGVLTSARLGRLWLLREASFAATAVSAFLAIRRKGPSRRRTIITIALTVGSLAAIAGSSHVGVGADRPLALLLLLVHLSFACAWAGAVVLLLLFLVLARTRGVRFPARPLMRSFGAAGACCVAVASVTGIALAARQVASIDAMLTTTYGQILGAKVLVVGLAGLLGLRTTLRLRRFGPTRTASLYRGVALEGAALLLALAAAGALSVGTPARGPAFTQSIAGGPPVVSAQVGDLLESAALTPNAVGQSWLRVDVNQTRRPAPAAVTGVTAALLGPDSRVIATRSLTQTEIANRWELGGVNLTAAGSWQLTMTVARAGLPDTVWHPGWIVASNPTGARRPLISDRSWESALDDTALLIAMLMLGVGSSAVWIDRRRRRDSTNEPKRSVQTEERVLVRL